MPDADIVLTELDAKGVLTLTMNRPDCLNSLNKPLIDAMLAALLDAEHDDAVRCIVLTGAGRGFCAGADLVNGSWPAEEGWTQGQITAWSMEHGFNPLVRRIKGHSKPVVGAINGIAAGGGVGLALAPDLSIAADTAGFKLVFAPQLGIIPDVGASWLVPNLVGRQRANGLALLGETLSATEAARWGMVWETVPADALMDRAYSIAHRLADGAIGGIKATAKAHEHALACSFDEQLNYELENQAWYCDQAEFTEGVRAFMEKRKPDFRNIKKSS